MYNKTLLYDTFNAKYLTYQQVAESFIPNDEFYQLLANNHTVLMGPRGCGKTTLLKMLTYPGLHYWNDEVSTEIKKSIPFIAVYIPSDIQWKNQLELIEKNFQKDTALTEKIIDFLITTNIQLALCQTMHSYIQFNFSQSPENDMTLEDKISRGLIDVWNIEKPISPSFDDIEIALQKRVIDINSLINKSLFTKSPELLLDKFPDHFFSNFFDIVKIGCSVFEKKLGFDNNIRWALCFDELEISPKFLQIKLLKFLRSVDQKYLFKLTTTPLFNLGNNLIEASQDNDFKAIKLWVHDDSGFVKWREFCSSLLTKKLQKRLKKENLKPAEVFGEYSIDDIIKTELNIKEKLNPGTGEGSSVNYLFKALSNVDDGFKQFLIERKIDFKNPFSQNAESDKSVFLKHKINVTYRLLFRNRTRKMPPIHYGVPYIYDICDGNPRAIIGLVDDILNKVEYDLYNNNFLISSNIQTEIIMDVSKKYFNLIRNHPDSTLTIRNKEFNLANDILRPIGNYIYSKIIKEDFVRSIHTTFTVDHEIDYKVLRLLEHALFIGAIVYLDPVESLSTKGLLGKRFRLSYLLTPLFRIPNRVNSQINLNSILKADYEAGDQVVLEFK